MSTFVLNKNCGLELPGSYVEIDRDEMEYVDGGSVTVGGAVAIIAGLVAAGWGTLNIGKECGKNVFNNGGDRWGSEIWNYKTAGFIVGGAVFGNLFKIGLDNGWVEASKA